MNLMWSGKASLAPELTPEGSAKVSHMILWGKAFQPEGTARVPFFFFLENLPNNILPLAWVVSPFMRLLSKYLSLSCLKLSTALGIKHVSYHGYKVLFNTFTSPNSSPFSLLLVSLAPDKTAFFLIFDHAN